MLSLRLEITDANQDFNVKEIECDEVK